MLGWGSLMATPFWGIIMSYINKVFTKEKSTKILIDLLKEELQNTSLSKKKQEEILDSMDHHIGFTIDLHEFEAWWNLERLESSK